MYQERQGDTSVSSPDISMVNSSPHCSGFLPYKLLDEHLFGNLSILRC